MNESYYLMDMCPDCDIRANHKGKWYVVTWCDNCTAGVVRANKELHGIDISNGNTKIDISNGNIK